MNLLPIDCPKYELCELDGLRMSKEQLSRAMRAIIQTGALIVESCEVDGRYRRPALNEARVRLWIPEGARLQFERLAGRPVTRVRT